MCIILSMYGGGFATVPAYLADMFGTQFVGAIHGRLLTAWSTAGIIGPLMIGYMRDAQIAAGVSREHVYDVTFLMLAGLLVVGFIANLLVRPVARKWFMSDAEVAALQADKAAMEGPGRSADIGAGGFSASISCGCGLGSDLGSGFGSGLGCCLTSGFGGSRGLGGGGLASSNETWMASSKSSFGRCCDSHHNPRRTIACSSTANATAVGDMRSEREWKALTAWSTACFYAGGRRAATLAATYPLRID